MPILNGSDRKGREKVKLNSKNNLFKIAHAERPQNVISMDEDKWRSLGKPLCFLPTTSHSSQYIGAFLSYGPRYRLMQNRFFFGSV